MQKYAPNTIVVNSRMEIIAFYGEASSLIRLRAGAVEYSLGRMEPRTLVSTISVAVHRAQREDLNVSYPGVDVEGTRYDLEVQPLTVQGWTQRLFAVLLTENKRSPVSEGDTVSEAVRERVSLLESELLFARENLQSTIEELETTNEELQATNEELLASNEELQSTNEELQSVNEELLTVNNEYQRKIEEHEDLTADINNMLNDARISVLYLDEELKIRRFSKGASEFGMMPHDIGRHIRELSLDFSYSDFLNDVNEVLNTLTSKQVENNTREGKHLWFNIAPYEEQNQPRGVVITLHDRTKERKGIETANTWRTRYETVMVEQILKTLKRPIKVMIVSKDRSIIELLRRNDDYIALFESIDIATSSEEAANLMAGRNFDVTCCCVSPDKTKSALTMDSKVKIIFREGEGPVDASFIDTWKHLGADAVTDKFSASSFVFALGGVLQKLQSGPAG